MAAEKNGRAPKKYIVCQQRKIRKTDLWRKTNPTKQTQNNVNFGCEMNHQNTAYQVISSDPLFSPSWRSQTTRSRFHHLQKGHVFTSIAEGWTLERILKHPSWSHLHQLGKLGTSFEGGNFTRNNGGVKNLSGVIFFGLRFSRRPSLISWEVTMWQDPQLLDWICIF